MDKSSQKPKQNCQICRKKFGGMFSNQHQCKRCQRTVCKQCCTKKKMYFTKTNTKLQQHRCCDLCWPQSQYIINYIKDKGGLMFNNLSLEGKQWSQLSQIETTDHKTPTKPKVKLQCKSFNDIWQAMTPSLRQLIGLLIPKIAVSSVESSIKYVCDKVTLTTNIYQSIAPLIIYLLCHCDSQNSIKVLNYLVKIAEEIDEQKIHQNMSLLCRQSKMDGKTQNHLINFAKTVYKSFTFLYFLNCLQLDIVHFVLIQTLLSGDPKTIQLLFCCIIFEYKQNILYHKYQDKSFKNFVWQNTNLKTIQKSIKKLRKLIIKANGISNKAPERSQKSQKPQKTQKTQKIQSTISKKQEQDRKQAQIKKQQQDKIIQDKILQKISVAQQFINKMQSQQLDDQQILPQDMESLQKYLDQIIEQNDRSLKECQQFDKLLLSIQDSLYSKTIPNSIT